jgi:predicted DCC family thiol-disulfide oxidoreductase YuxK
MTTAPKDTHNLEVWMDGACTLCQRSRTWCELRDTRDQIGFRDFRVEDDDELPVARAAHEASMWVQTADGEIAGGFEAWRLIMSAIPGWRWISWIAGLPPFCWLGPPVYRLIARHRGHLA